MEKELFYASNKGGCVTGVPRGQLGTNVIMNNWNQGKAAAEQRGASVKAGRWAGKGQTCSRCNLVPKSGVHIWAGSGDVRTGKIPLSGERGSSPGLGWVLTPIPKAHPFLSPGSELVALVEPSLPPHHP